MIFYLTKITIFVYYFLNGKLWKEITEKGKRKGGNSMPKRGLIGWLKYKAEDFIIKTLISRWQRNDCLRQILGDQRHDRWPDHGPAEGKDS